MEGVWRYDGIDRVTLRVIGGAFNTIAREMAQMLYRMSNSSIIRESEDLGCGLYDALANELCESESSPMHIGSLPAYIRGFMRKLAGQLYEATSSSTTTRTTALRTRPT